jgi:hypothetical protein
MLGKVKLRPRCPNRSSLDPFLRWWLVDRSTQFVVVGFLEVGDLSGKPRMNADKH